MKGICESGEYSAVDMHGRRQIHYYETGWLVQDVEEYKMFEDNEGEGEIPF